MDLRLKGKTVVVTGGSKGIGASIVKCFAEEGCQVHFCARSQSSIDSFVAELTPNLLIFPSIVDIRSNDSFSKWIDSIGKIDIFIPNVSALSGDWAEAIDTDLQSTVYNIDTVTDKMSSSESAVTYIGSTSAGIADHRADAYSCVKAALIHHIKSMSVKFARKIRFNTISPSSTLFPGGGWDNYRIDHPSLFQNKINRHPMKRLASPEEIARLVVFISSPLSSYVNGEIIHIDGGERSCVDL